MAECTLRFHGQKQTLDDVTGIGVVVCIAFLSIRGLSQSIDFTGGRNFKGTV